jgi:hypothetical protein
MTRPTDPSSMWFPLDPDEPTSELYRLMPPRRRSESREALDAAAGQDQDDHDDVPAADPALAGPPADRKGAPPRLAPFFGGVLSNALGGVLTAIALAAAAYLWTHLHHAGQFPAQRPPTPPAATATAHP